jgi:mannose-6-phosphate isomerase-like protein (cupin superfamily)
LHLTTTYALDSLGRQIRETDPNGNVDVTVFNDVNHSERTYIGWNSSTGQATGPTRVSRMDLSGTYNETLTMSAAPAIAAGKPTGTEAVSNIESLSRTYRNAASQITHRDDYFNLDGLTYSVDGNLGTEGVHFYRTRYQYNHQGLPEREQAPNGTINWRIYDGQRRLVSQWTFTPNWDSWEMHPHGEEVVLCTAGAIMLHQQFADGSEAIVTLGPGDYAINPRGCWHTADIAGTATVVFITPGLGTEGRPR